MFGKGTAEPSRPLLAPGVCWICDQAPQQVAHRVIDTRRNARPGGPTSHASVRKYICEPCALEMGAAMGMVSAEEHDAVATDRRMVRSELEQVLAQVEFERSQKVRVVTADEIADVVAETVRAELAKQVKPTPKKRAAASDE